MQWNIKNITVILLLEINYFQIDLFEEYSNEIELPNPEKLQTNDYYPIGIATWNHIIDSFRYEYLILYNCIQMIIVTK